MDEIDIWRTAKLLIEQRGLHARYDAMVRASELKARGDRTGAAVRLGSTMPSMNCGARNGSTACRYRDGAGPMSASAMPGAGGCDIEAESCSLAITEASAILSFPGINGERVSVVMPPIMLESLGLRIAALRPDLARRWSPKGPQRQP